MQPKSNGMKVVQFAISIDIHSYTGPKHEIFGSGFFT
jgi:hypothetical protein